MAKHIKAIKCPQCGSTKKTVLEPDHFRCANCDTDYFLDDDVITVHHKVSYESDAAPAVAKPASQRAAVVGGVAVVLVGMLVLMLRNLRSPDGAATTPAAHTEEYHWSNKDEALYRNSAGRPVLLLLGSRQYDHEAQGQTGTYLAFYDVLSGKELRHQRLQQELKTGSTPGRLAVFENGAVYATVNEAAVYRINTATMMLAEATPPEFTRHPELAAGVGRIEFVYRPFGDGFNLTTNDGKNFFYFPIADRLYTKDEKLDAERALEHPLPGARLKTYFAFSQKSTDYPDDKIQLFRYTQKDNAGGPNDRPYFEAHKDFWSGRTPQKALLRSGTALVQSYEDLTPGRLYFDPEVLYGDDDYVLIDFKATPAEGSNTTLQCLNARTGAIVFTKVFPEERYLDDEVVRYADGFVILSNVSAIAVSMNGTVIREFSTL